MFKRFLSWLRPVQYITHEMSEDELRAKIKAMDAEALRESISKWISAPPSNKISTVRWPTPIEPGSQPSQGDMWKCYKIMRKTHTLDEIRALPDETNN